MPNTNSLYSTMVRAGRTTYFVDVKEAKNGNKYISISENRINGEEKKRTTVRVFGESIPEFRGPRNDPVRKQSRLRDRSAWVFCQEAGERPVERLGLLKV